MNFNQGAGTGVCIFQWAIVYAAEAQAIDTLSLTNGASLYDPEQDVLTWGISSINNNTETKQYNGTTKSMRKLKVGDRLVIVTRGIATNTTDLLGGVQFFCKT